MRDIPMEDLPPEIIAIILAFVPPLTCARSRRVCSRFRDIVDRHLASRWDISEMKKAVRPLGLGDISETMRMAMRTSSFSLDEFTRVIARYMMNTAQCIVDFSKPHVFQHRVLPVGAHLAKWNPLTLLSTGDGNTLLGIPIGAGAHGMYVEYIYHTIPLELSIKTQKLFTMNPVIGAYNGYYILRELSKFTMELQMTITMFDGADHIIFVMQHRPRDDRVSF